MNNHEESPPEGDDWLAPPEWTVEITEEAGQHTALVGRSGRQMCRLSLAVPEEDAATARRLLADKARRWIWEYRNLEA